MFKTFEQGRERIVKAILSTREFGFLKIHNELMCVCRCLNILGYFQEMHPASNIVVIIMVNIEAQKVRQFGFCFYFYFYDLLCDRHLVSLCLNILTSNIHLR